MNQIKIFVLCSLLSICSDLSAQENVQFSLGYWGQAAIQPGLKLGASFDLAEITTKNKDRSRQLYLSPQLGFYSYSNVNQNYLANVEVGLISGKVEKGGFSSLGIGFAYLASNETIGGTLSIDDGSFIRQKELNSFFMPSLNYSYGGSINSRIGWYNKYSLGTKMNASKDSDLVIFVEFGLFLKSR